jgi:hypothetical protein
MVGVVEGIEASAGMGADAGRWRKRWDGACHRGCNPSWWSFEGETPETSASFFPPSLEDAYTVRVVHRNIFVGEDDLAALVGKRPQSHKGMGK